MGLVGWPELGCLDGASSAYRRGRTLAPPPGLSLLHPWSLSPSASLSIAALFSSGVCCANQVIQGKEVLPWIATANNTCRYIASYSRSL